MRTTRHLVPALLLATAIGACQGSSPTASSPTSVPDNSFAEPPAAPGPCAVGFDELRGNGAAFGSSGACGLTVTGRLATWQVSTSYGHPAPFVQFRSAAGVTATGEISVTGGAFAFVSVDLYSSTTKIPYEITGLSGGAVAFTLQDVQGNTFGNFATIANPRVTVPIDTLRIRLTNPAAPCCPNPVGVDNIRVVR